LVFHSDEPCSDDEDSRLSRAASSSKHGARSSSRRSIHPARDETLFRQMKVIHLVFHCVMVDLLIFF
jgi:hypothetical protein